VILTCLLIRDHGVKRKALQCENSDKFMVNATVDMTSQKKLISEALVKTMGLQTYTNPQPYPL
jgi:hypothetical protein